jgi:hypothetical protein
MFALRSRPLALPARHSASRGPVSTAAEVPPYASRTPVHAQALRSSVPCDSRAKCERYPAPLSSAPCALSLRSLAQERKLTHLLSMESDPSRPDPLRQPLYLQSVAHSLTPVQILTPTFPSSCKLFVRSLAEDRKLTNLYSCGCALFCRTTREGVRPPKANPRPANGFRGCYSRSAKKSEGLSEHQ